MIMKLKTKEDLAKFAINYFFINQKFPDVNKEDVSPSLQQKAACFVSVHIDSDLRGCIGNHTADEPIYLNIIKNAIKASTCDYRFFPLTKEELVKLDVEVSILTPLKEYKPKNLTELLNFLEKERPGVLIERGEKAALFLPQVWKELPKPREFLNHLCLKAGLSPSEWRKENIKYYIFNISESIT